MSYQYGGGKRKHRYPRIGLHQFTTVQHHDSGFNLGLFQNQISGSSSYKIIFVKNERRPKYS